MTAIQLAIALDRPDRTYLTGERITGALHITLADPTECDQLVVELAYQFGGKRGSGDGVESTDLLFQGSWPSGAHAVPFSMPVAAELPTYQGQLLTLTRMIRARLTPTHGPAVTDVAIVWIACGPRDREWFDPREEQQPPVLFVVNDAPIRLLGPKRALEAAVGTVLGRRRPATLEVRPRVLRGGEAVTITLSVRGPARRLAGLRARLVAVETWPRNEGVKTLRVHSAEYRPVISSDGGVTVLRVEVPLPEDAISIGERLQWRIQLRGAYGCLENRDRWQPLWVGPSESSLGRLRGRSDAEVAAAAADAAQALRATASRQWWHAPLGVLVVVLGVGIPLAVISAVESGRFRSGALAVLVGLSGLVGLGIWRKRVFDRQFQARQYRAGLAQASSPPVPSPAALPDAPPQPPAAPLVVDLLKMGESPASPDAEDRLRRDVAATQRRGLRRGVVGLSFILGVNLVAGLVAESPTLAPWIAIPLTALSVLALLASLLVSPSGRPLSCYVGMAPALVACWMAVSAVRAIVAAATGILRGNGADLLAALLLATGIVALWVGARRARPATSGGSRLLVLWVFGVSSRMEEIMRGVALEWVYLGPIQYLRGPGARADLARLIAALRRGSRQLYADTLPEVRAHLGRFRSTPNIFGIYSLNSLQCTNAVWREAVDALLDTTDVVMMDLTTFGEKNQGCAYELGLLIARMPASRLVLVVDGSTDIDLLESLLRRLWATMPATSPNRQANAGAIRLFRIPLRGAGPAGHLWTIVPMHDLVRLLHHPVG